MQRHARLLLVLGVLSLSACGGGGGGAGGPKTLGTGGSGGGVPVGQGPSISSVSPQSGAPGAAVTIDGSGFASAASGEVVRFGGTAAGIQSTSATRIVAVVPSMAAGLTTITVEVSGAASSGASFDVLAPASTAPAVTSLSPATGPAGTSVLLSGTNLGSVVEVRIGALSIGTTAGPRFAVPALPPGAYPVVAVDSSGQTSAPRTFILTPVLSSVLPTSAAPGATITLSGSNFGTAAVEVRFGTAAVASTTPSAAGDQASVAVPSPFPASLPATVQLKLAANPGTTQEAVSGALTFTVSAPAGGQPASISALSPTSGPAGTIVQAAGVAFGSSPAVTVGGVSASVSSGSTTAVAFAIPSSLSQGTYGVVVYGPGGASPAVQFTVTAPVSPARLVAIDPPGGIAGQLVTLRGAGFGAGASAPAVTFGSAGATVVSFTDASVAVRVPSGTGAGLFQVRVTPAGSTIPSGTVAFTISAAGAGTPGTFAATGSMSLARAGHTATLLATGEVLVAGGDATGSGQGGLASAEVYNPSMGSFYAVAGTMSSPRLGHSATRLPDGRVLLAGGHGDPGGGLEIYYSTDLYDPVTNTFSRGPDMLATRSGHVAVPLANGDILLAGGEGVTFAGGTPYPITTCEYYRYVPGGAGWFQAAAQFNYARLQAGAVPSFGGAIVVGGLDAQSELASAEIHDQVRGTWTKGSGAYFMMTIPRALPAVVRLANGDVVATGGYLPNFAGMVADDPMTTVDVMPTDPLSSSQGMFSIRRFGALQPRVAHTATVLADDRVLLVGSAKTSGAARSASIFNAAMTSGSATAGTPVTGRFDHTATLLFDGRVLLTGGGGDATQVPGVSGTFLPVTSSAELFKP